MYFAHFENISRCGTSEYDHETAASRKWRPREGHSDESYPVQVVWPSARVSDRRWWGSAGVGDISRNL